MRNYVFIVCLLFLGNTLLLSQEEETFEKEKRWELNTTELFFYNTKDKEDFWGTEVHLSYEIKEKLFLGASYCFKYGMKDKKANDLAFLFGYEPIEWLCFNNGLNISFIKEDDRKETEYAFYSEAEFIVLPYRNNVNLGPVIGATLGKSSELYAGIHLEIKL